MTECICKGNWRIIVAEVGPLIDRWFKDNLTGKEYCFYGLVHGSDDYYYGLRSTEGETLLSSCVGALEGTESHNFTLLPEDTHPKGSRFAKFGL